MLLVPKNAQLHATPTSWEDRFGSARHCRARGRDKVEVAVLFKVVQNLGHPWPLRRIHPP